MTVRFFRANHTGRDLFFSAVVTAVVALGGAACKDDSVDVDAQIHSFCESLLGSQGFACCSGSDKSGALFSSRNKYNSVDECAGLLSSGLSQSQGRRHFDLEAANSCLSHIAGRACGITPSSTVRAAEEAAGCGRVVAGSQAKGQPCVAQEDCKAGLFCPPIKDTGLSFCSTPAGSNEACYGAQAASVDHPACQPNLFCSLTGENPAGCPSPPCQQFNCVPFFDQGEPCSGLECAKGLACHEGLCTKGGPSMAGANCQITEHCADGLFCDPATAACTPRKAAGQACRTGNNPNLECKGFCSGSGESGVCSVFCSSG